MTHFRWLNQSCSEKTKKRTVSPLVLLSTPPNSAENMNQAGQKNDLSRNRGITLAASPIEFSLKDPQPVRRFLLGDCWRENDGIISRCPPR